MVKIATRCINFFCVYKCCKICYICISIFITLRGEIHNSIWHKLQNSMEVDSVGIIAILSMSYITTRIVKTKTSAAKISRVPVENQITTLSVVKIAIKFSPCTHSFIIRGYTIFRNGNLAKCIQEKIAGRKVIPPSGSKASVVANICEMHFLVV